MRTLGIVLLLSLAWTKVQTVPAVDCVPSQCNLPNCYCSSTNYPPGVTDITEYPQVVMLTFDDDVGTVVYDNFYKQLFDLTNPNGCNIGLTFFLSHDYTDYTLVNDLYKRGYEIASHSITHQTPTTYWQQLKYDGWVNEMQGQREIASYLANIPIDTIVGARAPFLQGGGNVMIQALSDFEFQYDSTMPTLRYTNPPLYPYTFDYKTIQECEIPPCPTNSFPSFWEMPLIDFNTTSGVPCSMLDGCASVTGVDETYEFLLYNFNLHYTTNRAPTGLFTHASWFLSDETHFPGYLKFLQYLRTLPDVYVVTVKQAIEWVKSPTKTVDIPNFAPWACSNPTAACDIQECYYPQTTPGGERYMNSCVACPPNYPWLGDPYGNRTTLKAH